MTRSLTSVFLLVLAFLTLQPGFSQSWSVPVISHDPNYSDINVRLVGEYIPSIRFTRWTGTVNHYHNAFVGQFWNTNYNNYSLTFGVGQSTSGDQNYFERVITIPINGNVGIGTEAPAVKLDLLVPATGATEELMRFQVSDASSDFLKVSNATGAHNQFIPSIEGHHTSDNRMALYLTGSIESSNDYGIYPITVFDARLSNGPAATRPLFGWDSYGNRKMTLTYDGKLGIGTTTPSELLSVNGTIRSKEVKVEAAPWPDYVFEDDYLLTPLSEVETYVREHHHLPELPSEKEVLENGVEVSATLNLLLKKIEELTLYTIEREKQLDHQAREIETLKKKSKN